MPNNHSYIADLCAKLHKRGTQPTVALIKKHAQRPLPLPVIVAALQRWKNDPTASIENDNQPQQEDAYTLSQQDKIDALELRVARLETLVEELQLKLIDFGGQRG